MKQYLLRKSCDYIMGHLRYGHLETIIEAENLEKAEAIAAEEDPTSWNLVVDDYEIEDWDSSNDPIEIEEITSTSSESNDNLQQLYSRIGVEAFENPQEAAIKEIEEYASRIRNLELELKEIKKENEMLKAQR